MKTYQQQGLNHLYKLLCPKAEHLLPTKQWFYVNKVDEGRTELHLPNNIC
jgi:hypothetical protein